MQQCPCKPMTPLGQSRRARSLICGHDQHSIACEVGNRDAGNPLVVWPSVPGALPFFKARSRLNRRSGHLAWPATEWRSARAAARGKPPLQSGRDRSFEPPLEKSSGEYPAAGIHAARLGRQLASRRPDQQKRDISTYHQPILTGLLRRKGSVGASSRATPTTAAAIRAVGASMRYFGLGRLEELPKAHG